MDNIEEIIERTVEKTIARMTVAGVIKVDQKPVTQKTVDLLERYEQLKLSDQPFSKKVVAQIDTALDQIRKDPFFSIIPMFYFEKVSREDIAFHFGVNEKTITRNRKRLVRQMSVMLFSDDVIMDILS
jgi:DNA-directed RNA polymerase specialized sigma subunit